MKELIKKIAASAGYKIERLDNPNPLEKKFRETLKELFNAYKDMKFPGLNLADDATIDLMCKLDGTQMSEAIYLVNALMETQSLNGDVCEFGVAQGFTSALIAHTIRNSKKELWLFDSFEGLPTPTSKDKLINDIFNLKSIEAYAGTMKHGKESVLSNLRATGFPEDRTNIVPGFIEESILKSKLAKQVTFAYVDFDFYNPIKVALNYLNTVLVSGGIIMVDDYNFFSEGAKVAVDEFLSERATDYQVEVPNPAAGKFILLRKR